MDISQIVTGGHNPRGNAICERVNQTLGAMIRKLSDLDYKDLKGFLPSFEFMINTALIQFGHQVHPIRDCPWTSSLDNRTS
jgi:hypothetical protein